MSQISPELKAAIYTYVSQKFTLKRQEGESGRDMTSSSSATGPSRASTGALQNLIPLSNDYLDNLLVAYSENQPLSNVTREAILDPIPEETEADPMTPRNEVSASDHSSHSAASSIIVIPNETEEEACDRIDLENSFHTLSRSIWSKNFRKGPSTNDMTEDSQN
jgi:hypothetical protein